MRKVLCRGKLAGELYESHKGLNYGKDWVVGWYCPNPFDWPMKDSIASEETAAKGRRCAWDIDYHTLGRYSEEHDKNGTRIFEDDIARRSDSVVGVVKYGRYNSLDSNSEVKTDLGFYIDWPDDVNKGLLAEGVDYEIIGNIYDNPEVIKG